MPNTNRIRSRSRSRSRSRIKGRIKSPARRSMGRKRPVSIPRSTQALLEQCRVLRSSLPDAQTAVLDIASYQSSVAQALGCGYLHDHWGACRQAEALGVAPVYHRDALPEGPYRAIFLDGRELDPSLLTEWIGQAASLLVPGGLLYTTASPANLSPWFAEVENQGEVRVAQSPRIQPHETPLGDQPAPEAISYPLEVGGQTLAVASAPGVFSPRGLDPGTQAMLAVIEADLAKATLSGASPAEAEPAPAGRKRFLDLGCGAGAVSLAASQVWGFQVTAVDVSARALRLTRLNAPEAEVLASDGFSALQGREFDLIASNPPYHTDFAVAKGFIEGAHHHLAAGGWLYLVVKRAEWYVQKIRTVFGGCRVTERDGYAVIAAERRELRQAPAGDRTASGQPAPKHATTRKHAKRMAASGRRRIPK